MKRSICVVTGTRAEYGLLRWVMQFIKDDTTLKLQLIATGMHLSPEFGLTYKDILADGFEIDRKIEMLTSSDTEVGIAKSIGLGVIGFADAFSELKPDVIILLGDRFEIFSAAVAATVARIPVAHLHGGEKTEGAFDEAFRHAITKMSHLHFTATEEYRNRVIQMGELPEHCFLTGGLGIDSIKRMTLLPRHELEGSLGLKLGEKNLLVTFHPATLEANTAEGQMGELLYALAEHKDTTLIFTLPNADTGGRRLIKMTEEFVASNANAHAFASLGQLRYLSAIAQVDGVIGNSSSGLIEVPSFNKGTINIGSRQRGRIKASSVIDCAPLRDDISAAIDELFSPAFSDALVNIVNPYGNGGASKKVVDTLKTFPLEDLIMKPFYDIPIPAGSE
ncbi:MAG: UDP-N-acetylglucosamine 2-epimerase [Halioglobus sp.]